MGAKKNSVRKRRRDEEAARQRYERLRRCHLESIPVPQELAGCAEQFRACGLVGLLASMPRDFQAVVLPGALPKWTGRIDPGPLVVQEVFGWLIGSKGG